MDLSNSSYYPQGKTSYLAGFGRGFYEVYR